MGVHVARFESGGTVQWGAVDAGKVHPIAGGAESLAEFLAGGREEAAAAISAGGGVPLDSVSLVSPVTGPCSLVCQGLNYSEHRAEAGSSTVSKPPFNMMFCKAWTSLSGPYDDVVRPRGVTLLDYELELGIVVGKAIEGPVKVTNENLHEYVAGVAISNDVSARDVQIPQQQWFKGKSFRTFCPVGPYLYLLDKEDVSQVLNLDIELCVNGETRQKASTSQLLYGPAETITELSRIMNLYPGDFIQTGTPGGVAIKAPSARAQRIARILFDEKTMFKKFMERQSQNPNYLKDGDVISCTMRSPDGAIDLGEMKTRVVPAP